MLNKYSNNKIIAILAVMAMALSAVAIIADDSSADAGTSYEVTDGLGNTVTFNSVPEHIITIGRGITATAIQLGDLNKIVVCDSYSKTDANAVFDDLRTAINAGKIAANGNIYSSGKANLEADIINAADTAKGGVFDKEKDVIVITGSNIASIISDLKTEGFTKILAWNDITDYSKIVGFVSSVSLAFDGKVTSKVNDMNKLTEEIASKTSSITKKEAFYVTYSGSAYKVGNTGSLANSMIVAAGGVSITTDASKSGSTYETNLTILMENHQNAVIFVDNTIWSDDAKLATLKTSVGENATLVNLDPLWNNYSIASMDGVSAMYAAMYPAPAPEPQPEPQPEPTPEKKSDDNTLVIAGGVAAAVVIIGIIALLVVKRH